MSTRSTPAARDWDCSPAWVRGAACIENRSQLHYPAHMEDRDPPADPAPSRPAPRLPPPRRIEAQTLLGDAVEVEIVQGDETYRLRRTRNGKLILTK